VPAREAAAEELRNAAALAGNFVIGRIGWIFKTESVIVPAFVDAVAGPGWIRGLLPILNRLAQSVPPFLFARRVKIAPRKKWVLMGANLAQALAFAAIGLVVLWVGGAAAPPWLVWLFLLLYTAFFAAVGIMAMAVGTLQGKLVAASHRGRLMAVSTSLGALLAAAAAWWWLPGFMQAPGAEGFGYAFLCTGVMLALASLCALFLREPPDAFDDAASGLVELGRSALVLLRAHRDFRRAVVLNALFVSSLSLLPHYQALARERLGLGGSELMLWVVVQNVSMAAVSLGIGPLADRAGNRLALRISIFATALVPLFAIWIARLPPEQGARWFVLVFVGVGFTPVVLRVYTNYVLEVMPRPEHPRALAISQLCSVGALAASPGLGAAVDVVGFAPVFVAVSLLMGVGGALTFGLSEPRHAL
jgi:hypothetical protein